MIVGAGSGGLCLAQGLKSDNIAFDVFERDYSPTDRLQGYRLSINAGGASALRSCLPVLLEGLDPFIHFGKKFVEFEDAPEGRVTARFQDASSATGDVLIGADGAGSHLRNASSRRSQRSEQARQGWIRPQAGVLHFF